MVQLVSKPFERRVVSSLTINCMGLVGLVWFRAPR